MRMLRGAVIAPIAVAIAWSSAVGMAQDREGGPYVSVSGLLVVPRDAKWADRVFNLDVDMKTGFGFLAAVGYSLPSGLRTELELGYRKYDFEGPDGFEVQGNFSTISLMANGIYSFDLEGFRPYAGLGLGLAQNSAEIDSITVAPVGRTFHLRHEGEAEVFAYQLLAGIGHALSDRAEVRLGYRYFGSAQGNFGQGINIASANHNFEIGLAYRF